MNTGPGSMKEALLQIEALQDATKRLEQFKRDRQALDLDVVSQERAARDKKRRAEEAHGARLEAAKTADANQLEISRLEGEITKFETEMNGVRQNAELKALQQAIASRRADILRKEEQGLMALEQADALTAQEEALLREAEAAEQDLLRVRQETAGSKDEYAGLIEQAGAECEGIRSQIRPAVLTAYERLAGHERGHPLARVKDRTCGGCFTRVTKQTENLLMHGEAVVHCSSCGRMLMLDEA